MKVPLPCPHGCGYTLELDVTCDHQHIRCHECLQDFCAVCIGTVTIHDAEAARRAKAHLN